MSSQAGATSVTYRVQYTAATTGTVKGVVVDFCGNASSPIIGDVCTAPTGFSVGTPTVANQSGITGFTAAAANSGRTLTLTSATGSSMTAGSTVVSFELTTATNPTTSNQTFYARILTYANDSGAGSPTTYTTTANGTDTTGSIDAGGIALSTADQITVQAKVQERLTFCVYTSAVNYTSCSGVSTTNPVTLGDSNGVLSPSSAYVNKTTKYNVSTNASNNVTIRAKGGTLGSGSNSITAIGATPATSTVGAEQFGFCTHRDTGGGTTGLTPDVIYNGDVGGGIDCSDTTAGASGDGGADFAYDITTVNDNLTSTYGDTIATKAPGEFSTGLIAFIGNISNTTEPGVYTTTMTFIATGNY